jgi:hypothetical protein
MESNVIPFPKRGLPPEAAGGFVAPSGGPGTFTAHAGRPFWWRDAFGMAHACEGAEIQPETFTFWTLCQIDVPPDEPFHPAPREMLACPRCLAVIRQRIGRVDSPARASDLPGAH